MSFLNKLKPSKQMTDDELYQELLMFQKIAHKRGEHAPVPVTGRGETPEGQTPPLHRSATEKQLDAMRQAFDADPETRNDMRTQVPGSSMQTAQNAASDVARGIRKGVSNSPMTGSAAPALQIGARQKQYILNQYKFWGGQGVSFEEAKKKVGPVISGSLDAYNEGKALMDMGAAKRYEHLKKQEQKKK